MTWGYKSSVGFRQGGTVGCISSLKAQEVLSAGVRALGRESGGSTRESLRKLSGCVKGPLNYPGECRLEQHCCFFITLRNACCPSAELAARPVDIKNAWLTASPKKQLACLPAETQSVSICSQEFQTGHVVSGGNQPTVIWIWNRGRLLFSS